MHFQIMPVVDLYSIPSEHEEAIQDHFNLGGDQTTQLLFRDWGTKRYRYLDSVRPAIEFIFAFLPDEYDRCIVKI